MILAGRITSETGTFCLTEGHSLLHRYHDFDPFEKHLCLGVIHP
jgi:hypothetical protein